MRSSPLVFKSPVPTSTAIQKIHNSNTLEDFLQVSLSFSEPSEEKTQLNYCSEFVLNHLHSSHKHRRFNGDSLDMTMVVPQVDVEQNSNTIR